MVYFYFDIGILSCLLVLISLLIKAMNLFLISFGETSSSLNLTGL